MPDSDNIVITGGFSGFTAKGLTRVVSYNTQGKATLLPSLQQQRYYHGCGYYYNNDEVVSCKLYIEETVFVVKLRRGSGKDWQEMASKVKRLKS